MAGGPADHALERSRGGLGTKLHLVCDRVGNPPTGVFTGGQEQEVVQFERVRAAVPARPGKPRALAGDKG